MLSSEVSRCLLDFSRRVHRLSAYGSVEADAGRRRPFCQAESEAIQIYCCSCAQQSNECSIVESPVSAWSAQLVMPRDTSPSHPSWAGRSPGRPLPRPVPGPHFPSSRRGSTCRVGLGELAGRRPRRKETWSVEGHEFLRASRRQILYCVRILATGNEKTRVEGRGKRTVQEIRQKAAMRPREK